MLRFFSPANFNSIISDVDSKADASHVLKLSLYGGITHRCCSNAVPVDNIVGIAAATIDDVAIAAKNCPCR